MAKLLLQVQEWERLLLPTELDTSHVRERLLAAGQTAGGPALRSTGRHLYARDFVGLIDAGFVQLQIVPKLYDDSTVVEGARSLCDLLLRSGLPIKPAILPARIREGRLSLLEGLYKHIADECNRLLLAGTPRRYSPVVEVAQVIRGRIQINRLARRRIGTEHLVPLRYSPLQQDNPLSRTLRAVALRLGALTRVSRTRLMFQRCDDLLHAAKAVPLTPGLVESVTLSRLEKEWAQTIEVARMLASGSLPDVLRTGDTHGVSFLFQIDGLFETIVRAATRRALSDTPLCLRQDRRAGFLLKRESDGAQALALNPDLLIETLDTHEVVVVGDAKWKRLDLDRSNSGIRRDDIYQLLAYMERCALQTGVIIFPMIARSDTTVSVHKYAVAPRNSTITVVQIAVDKLLSADVSFRQSIELSLREIFLSASGRS